MFIFVHRTKIQTMIFAITTKEENKQQKVIFAVFLFLIKFLTNCVCVALRLKTINSENYRSTDQVQT
jgi:hypothetical protein